MCKQDKHTNVNIFTGTLVPAPPTAPHLVGSDGQSHYCLYALHRLQTLVQAQRQKEIARWMEEKIQGCSESLHEKMQQCHQLMGIPGL